MLQSELYPKVIYPTFRIQSDCSMGDFIKVFDVKWKQILIYPFTNRVVPPFQDNIYTPE